MKLKRKQQININYIITKNANMETMEYMVKYKKTEKIYYLYNKSRYTRFLWELFRFFAFYFFLDFFYKFLVYNNYLHIYMLGLDMLGTTKYCLFLFLVLWRFFDRTFTAPMLQFLYGFLDFLLFYYYLKWGLGLIFFLNL